MATIHRSARRHPEALHEFGTNLNIVAEFGLHAMALSAEALKSPGNSEGGLPGLFRASKRATKCNPNSATS